MDISTFIAHRKTLAADSGDIAYAEFGDGGADSPVALFVHGLGTNGALWRHVIERLPATTRCVAIDLPGHGATPPRDDNSVAALAGTVTELCDGLGLGQVDLIGNDTGGAVTQIFAARHPGRLRTLTLTNCDTNGNFPPPEFDPVIELARQGQLAESLVAIVSDPAAWRGSPLVGGYEHPENIPDEALGCYFEPIGGTIEKARTFERTLAALDPAYLADIDGALRALTVPTLIAWGTGDEVFGLKWAQQLRETLPGARDIVEVEGAKVFFPEERPGELVPHLRSLWGR
jgi:pimeloyl-ACP methyl ester carboxylesterase